MADNDEGKQDGEGGDEGEQKPSDIDKLRSSYDSKIAEQNKAIEGLTSELQRIKNAGASHEAVQAVEKLLEELDDEEDSTRALARAKDIARDIVQAAANTSMTLRAVNETARQATAQAKALELVRDYETDFQPLQKRLAAATTPREMDLLYKEIQLELKEGGKARSNGSKKAPDDNEVDEGRGRRGRSNTLLDDLRSDKYDMSTPEGRANFAKDQDSLHRRMTAPSR